MSTQKNNVSLKDISPTVPALLTTLGAISIPLMFIGGFVKTYLISTLYHTSVSFDSLLKLLRYSKVDALLIILLIGSIAATIVLAWIGYTKGSKTGLACSITGASAALFYIVSVIVGSATYNHVSSATQKNYGLIITTHRTGSFGVVFYLETFVLIAFTVVSILYALKNFRKLKPDDLRSAI